MVTATSPEASDARDLVAAYRHHLAALANRTEGFFDHPTSVWNGERYSYFDRCRRTLPSMRDAAICYVPTPTGVKAVDQLARS